MHDWRTRHTHTLRVERTSYSYDPTCKFGAWVTGGANGGRGYAGLRR